MNFGWSICTFQNKSKWYYFNSCPFIKWVSWMKLLIFLKGSLTHLCVCYSSICPARNNRYAYICLYTHAHAYTTTYTCLIRLRQSLQQNGAFVKALIGPFWPNYHTLIKISPNGSSGAHKENSLQMAAFHFPPFFFSILK